MASGVIFDDTSNKKISCCLSSPQMSSCMKSKAPMETSSRLDNGCAVLQKWSVPNEKRIDPRLCQDSASYCKVIEEGDKALGAALKIFNLTWLRYFF